MNSRPNIHDERDNALDELDADAGQGVSQSGGQSGDTQTLSQDGVVTDESVVDLAEDDQAYEAGAVEGVEDAGNHPEQPVRSHEDRRPALDGELAPDPDWK